jgi:prepilin-type N-terminal cleavage/methylation domain-containing protein
MRSSREDCSAGVTLIELIAVLAILGVAIALVTPSLFASVDRFQLNATGRRLVDAFRLARNEARFGQRDATGVVKDNEFVIFRGTSRVSAVPLPTNLEVRTASGQPIYTFLPSGQILGPERLELQGSGRNQGVIILGPPPGTVRFELQQ